MALAYGSFDRQNVYKPIGHQIRVPQKVQEVGEVGLLNQIRKTLSGHQQRDLRTGCKSALTVLI